MQKFRPYSKWVSEEEIEKALKERSKKVKEKHPEVLKVGYFGSYARGNWSVGAMWTYSYTQKRRYKN